MCNARRTVLAPAVIALLLAALAGCASAPGPDGPAGVHPAGPGPEGDERGWWYARFRMHWPEGTEPMWHLDLFLAHRVVLPVLDRERENVDLWRFHRRAANDQAGHQFSFIFYSTPEAAQRIFNGLRADMHLAGMKQAGFIMEDTYDDTGRITRPAIEDTCDSRWSDSVRKSWPYFIMGASRMWVDLVSRVAEDLGREKRPSTPREIESFYKLVNDSVTKVWQQEGQHAFLHHLNALFGYEPMIVYEQRMLKF